MSEALPVIAFGDRPAIQLWSHAGLHCAIYWGHCGFNGYVQLPPGHVEREFAEAYAEVKRQDHEADPDPLFPWYIPSGYDAISAETHGGLTYGPDEQGWVGFDTSHACDDWTEEEIEAVLCEHDPTSLMDYREKRQLFAAHMPPGFEYGPAGRVAKRHGLAWYRLWTMSELIAEVEGLAEQLAAAARAEL